MWVVFVCVCVVVVVVVGCVLRVVLFGVVLWSCVPNVVCRVLYVV